MYNIVGLQIQATTSKQVFSFNVTNDEHSDTLFMYPTIRGGTAIAGSSNGTHKNIKLITLQKRIIAKNVSRTPSQIERSQNNGSSLSR